MTTTIVTVVDRIPFTASVSPSQAAAYVRRKLPEWEEEPGVLLGGTVPATAFYGPWYAAHRSRPAIYIPAAHARDYSLRMREAVDTLVALGCTAQPSEVLRAMAAEPDAVR